MANTIKGKATLKDGTVLVRAIFTHPMTVEARDAAGKITTEAHFIQQVVCTYKGETIFAADWGQAISTNPYIEFSFKGGAVGEVVALSWSDNKGQSDKADVQIA